MPDDERSPERQAAAAVRARIAQACLRAGRDPDRVTLVAATKTVSARQIVAAGVADAGENRVQELLIKHEALQGLDLRWHFIGTLQRNKARKIAGLVSLIHSVDSVPLAEAINAAAHDAGIVQAVLIQVNVSGEASKAGIAPDNLSGTLDRMRPLRSIHIQGLMTVPAAGDPQDARPAFRNLAALAGDHGLEHLSMGMSHDFEVAVEEGATLVRVGTAIFGQRPAPE